MSGGRPLARRSWLGVVAGRTLPWPTCGSTGPVGIGPSARRTPHQHRRPAAGAVRGRRLGGYVVNPSAMPLEQGEPVDQRRSVESPSARRPARSCARVDGCNLPRAGLGDPRGSARGLSRVWALADEAAARRRAHTTAATPRDVRRTHRGSRRPRRRSTSWCLARRAASASCWCCSAIPAAGRWARCSVTWKVVRLLGDGRRRPPRVFRSTWTFAGS